MQKRKRCTCTLFVCENCNLNCTYCYEHQKTTAVMPLTVAQDAITKTFRRAREENVPFVEILFHGGEPFLAFDTIKEICEWMWSRNWPFPYMCVATTNGTVVHGKIKQWLTENRSRFVCCLSLDGTPKSHNLNRSGSYSKIDTEFFLEMWSNQGVKMTPSPDTLGSLYEDILYIQHLGFRNTICTFASGVDWTKRTDGTFLDYENVLKEQLKRLAVHYLDNPEEIPPEMLCPKFSVLAIQTSRYPTKLCGAGTIMRCWSVDGRMFPCHLFYEVWKKTGIHVPCDKLISEEDIHDVKCDGCPLEALCPTCYGGNYFTFSKINERDEYSCKITKIRFLVGSWFVGQMLLDKERYVVTRNMTDSELAATASGVLLVQRYLERSTNFSGANR